MPTKAISFLGFTKPGQPYRETTYHYRGEECTTPFMAEATAYFFRKEIDALLVLVTKEAEEQNFADLEQRFNGVLKPTPVPIPSGLNEDQLWQIFTRIGEQIAPGDTIVFDITNGFRSLPVLAFLATSYLRVVRGATVAHMVYGAYDASVVGKTPVFELTPFLALLDWTTATDAFLKYGRADDLTQLVQQHPAYKRLGATLEQLTAALQTSRPLEVMESASRLQSEIGEARRITPAQIQPFDLLLERIADEYTPLAHENPIDPKLAHEVIVKQLEVIEWYIKKKLYVQALTGAREWLVSLILMYTHQNLFHKQQRANVENLLNDRPYTTIHVQDIANLDTIRMVWKKTTPARNAVAHHINKPKAETARDIENAAQEVGGALRGLLH